jgi:hypothetical protein
MCWLLKRWWFWAGTGFMLVAVVAGYLLIPAGRISQATCDKIQRGWSTEQVVNLLGKPQFGELPLAANCEPGRRSGVSVIWCDEDRNAILVNFNMNEIEPHVMGKIFDQTSLSFYERMKGRVERRVRALWP